MPECEVFAKAILLSRVRYGEPGASTRSGLMTAEASNDRVHHIYSPISNALNQSRHIYGAGEARWESEVLLNEDLESSSTEIITFAYTVQI